MKIGITGAHSTGKSTLIDGLFEHKIINKVFTKCTEGSRKFQQLTREPNQLQELILKQYFFDAMYNDDMIADRISLDGVVYTEDLNKKGVVNADILQLAYDIHRRCWPHYDLIFYLKPEFEIEDDGFRETDPMWQTDIARRFEFWLNSMHPYPTKVITLSGTAEQRIEKALMLIKERI